jgi:hypothetical protein
MLALSLIGVATIFGNSIVAIVAPPEASTAGTVGEATSAASAPPGGASPAKKGATDPRATQGRDASSVTSTDGSS